MNQTTAAPPAPCAMAIFGAPGDLTQRKLLPALVNRARERLLPPGFAVVGLARRPLSDEDFRAKIEKELGDLRTEPGWTWLKPRLFYVRGDLNDAATYGRLRDRLAACDKELGTGGNYLFYLSTAPEHFAEAAQQLGEAGLTREGEGRWRRLVIEKPFGHDLASARELNHSLRAVMDEGQLYRIDHYLGKETVQNVLVLRFANGIFEPLWNRRYINHVQITVAESVGVEGRGDYYDTAG